MSATSLDLSQIKTDALSAAASFRTLIGLGSGNTPTFLALALSGQSLTGSQATSLIDASATWNTTGIPTLIKANVTDTASNTNSLLMDLQVGGASQMRVRKDGRIVCGTLRFLGNENSGIDLRDSGSGAVGVLANNTRCVDIRNGSFAIGQNPLFWGPDPTSVPDIGLHRDSSNTLAQRNAGNAQTFRIYNTFTDSSNYERGKLEWASNVLRIGTEKAGTGSARALELQTDGTTRLGIGTTGVASFTPATLTGSSGTSAIDITQTWNTTGIPTLIKANVVDTASSSSSLLMDLQVGGVSQFNVMKDGKGYLGNCFYHGGSLIEGYNIASAARTRNTSGRSAIFGPESAVGLALASNFGVSWSSSTAGSGDCFLNRDLFITRDAAGTLAQRNAGNAQRFNLYGTYTDASNYRRLYLNSTTAGAFTLGVEGAGTGASGNTLAINNLLNIAATGSWLQVAGVDTGSWVSSPQELRFGGVSSASYWHNLALYASGRKHLTLTQGFTVNVTPFDLTGSDALTALDIAQTWNTTGTPTAFKLNVTDTASNASSLLMDLQVGGSSRFSVNKAGQATVSGSQTVFGPAGVGRSYINISAGLNLASNMPFGWTSGTDAAGTSMDTVLTRDAAGTLAQRNATAAQRFNLYGTFTNSSNYERMFLEYNTTGTAYRVGTEKAGTGSARALELQTDGTTRLTIDTSGKMLVNVASSFAHTHIKANSGAASLALEPATNNVSGVYFGGNSGDFSNSILRLGNSFDMQVTSNGALTFRTGSPATERLSISATGLFTIADALNIAVGTTTGTKIGTGTTQKLAFWNATPVVQPTAVADATDAASVITQLNALLSRMRDLGLIAT